MALAANALTTVAAVEVVVGDGTFVDARIEQLINAVSDAAEHHCGCSFGRTAVSTSDPEYYTGTGRSLLILDRRPIVSIQRIRIDQSEITDYSRTPQYDKQGLLYRQAGWPRNVPIHGDLTSDPDVNLPKPNIDVAYTAGYILPQAGVTRTLPYDLEQIVIDEVVRRLVRPNPGLKSERTPGGHSQTWADDAPGFLSQEARSALNAFIGRHFG